MEADWSRALGYKEILAAADVNAVVNVSAAAVAVRTPLAEAMAPIAAITLVRVEEAVGVAQAAAMLGLTPVCAWCGILHEGGPENCPGNGPRADLPGDTLAHGPRAVVGAAPWESPSSALPPAPLSCPDAERCGGGPTGHAMAGAMPVVVGKDGRKTVTLVVPVSSITAAAAKRAKRRNVVQPVERSLFEKRSAVEE